MLIYTHIPLSLETDDVNIIEPHPACVTALIPEAVTRWIAVRQLQKRAAVANMRWLRAQLLQAVHRAVGVSHKLDPRYERDQIAAAESFPSCGGARGMKSVAIRGDEVTERSGYRRNVTKETAGQKCSNYVVQTVCGE